MMINILYLKIELSSKGVAKNNIDINSTKNDTIYSIV